MNLVFDYAKKMGESYKADNKLTKDILAELGVESVQSFNDDDWYTYNTETMELQAGRQAHYERPTQPAAPLKTVKGMTARYLGLWQYKVQA